jgi:hypothetical protein
MTFDVAPAAVPGPVGQTTITMTASVATDPDGVEYLFTNTTLATDSGWQAGETWTETGLTAGTTYSYNVKARDAVAFLETAASTPDASATTNAATGTNPLVYEPFAYPVGGLNGASGLSEIGLDGTWNASGDSYVVASSLTYGSLPAAGEKFGALSGGSNRYGGARTISSSALAGNGLLDDGAILWFSMEMGYDGGNATNTTLAFALANNQFTAGNFSYQINNEGPLLGSGVGVIMGRTGTTNGTFRAAQFSDPSTGTGFSGITNGTTDAGAIVLAPNPDHTLIVGKITWGANGNPI